MPERDQNLEPSKLVDKATAKHTKTKIDNQDAELSPEDEQLKQNLHMLVQRSNDQNHTIRQQALTQMADEIRNATSSMTSVPKPLKFLRDHYPTLKRNYDVHAAQTDSDDATTPMLADVLSVLAMTMQEDGERETLKYKLLGQKVDISSWGHEYVRHLATEVGEEYNARLAASEAAADADADGDVNVADAGRPAADLLPLVLDEMAPFFISHNSEAEAVDLLMEVGHLEALVPLVDKTNCERICLYLEQVASYVPEPEDAQVLTVAVGALRKLGRYSEALRVALRLGDVELASDLLTSCDDA